WGRNQYQTKAAEANLKNSELNLENQKKSIRRNVLNTVERVREATNRVEVLKRSQELAQRTYDISLDQFNRGEASSQDLTLAQNRLTRAQSAYLNAFISYKIAMADLSRQTMWDFERGVSLKLR
ncbi:TolC family protein, partial [candidate division KSB1 bacterium]